MNGVVQIQCLGNLGRFGNQLFQYACARGYARSVGATLETPDWIGKSLFKNVHDGPVTSISSTLPQDVVPTNGETNINLHGYFQHSEAFKLYTLADLREWFTLQDWVLEEMAHIRPVPLAAHLRRGDYVSLYSGSFCVIGEQAYTDAFKAHHCEHLPVTWVREDQPRPFKRPGLDWLIDFVTLMRSSILFRANSTFSWWAATLGNHDFVYSPVVDGKRGCDDNVLFVNANWPRCTDQPNVHDYHIQP